MNVLCPLTCDRANSRALSFAALRKLPRGWVPATSRNTAFTLSEMLSKYKALTVMLSPDNLS